MIETVGVFISRNFRRQVGRVFVTTHPYLSGVIAIGLVFFTSLSIKPSLLYSVFFPYDTVVFGFTATAIALAIAIPSERFVTFLSGIKDGTTPFKDFLFILAWNGLVHIVAFFLFLPFVFLPADWAIDAGKEITCARVYVFILLWVQLYACFQFLVTTLGVYELADLYASYCARQRRASELSE